MVFDMAPKTETTLNQPVLSFTDLKASLIRLEEYYTYYNIHEDHVKIQRAKITADREILEICHNARETPSNWIEFRKILEDEKLKRLTVVQKSVQVLKKFKN